MAVLISGIVIFVVMAIIAAVSWIVGTIRGLDGQPVVIKIVTVVGVFAAIICTVCYLCDDTLV